ncbi:MAG: hypothetical protein WC455_10015 [Dehalococcoidia bacterium]|jgi:hypothetical protein
MRISKMEVKVIPSKPHLKMAKRLRKLADSCLEQRFHVLGNHLQDIADEYQAVGYGKKCELQYSWEELG